MPSFTLAEIAKKIDGELVGDPSIRVENAAEIDKAEARHITFLANPKYRGRLAGSAAAAVIIDGQLEEPPDMPHIKTANAYFAFLQAFLMFNPPQKFLEAGIHESAAVDPSARIGSGSAIGANVFIGPRTSVGERCQIYPNCVILGDVHIGDDCVLYPLVSIRENCRIGSRAIVHNGTVVGSDGFGFAPHEGRFHKIPQIGRVVIGDDVEIGANCTIDRATMGETVIGDGVKLDNLIQVAHNVTIGAHTVIAAQSGIAGSTRIGSHAMIGGQVAIAGHIKLSDGVQIAAKSGVSKSFDEGAVLYGIPARPIMKAKRIEAVISTLPELVKRVRQLEKELAALSKRDA